MLVISDSIVQPMIEASAVQRQRERDNPRDCGKETEPTRRMFTMKRSMIVAALAATGICSGALAQNEQFIPANFYWVGPYAPGGSGFGGGMIDYFALLNERDGGINGVRLTWEKCETEYRNDRGVECYERSKKKGPTGATVIHPLSTGITYSLIEKGTADKIPIISMGYGRTDAADGRVFPYVFPMITTYWSQNTAKIKFIGQKEGGMEKLKGKKIVNL
jgi:branched-chain amino acid transport system substrate-binding protein